MNGTNLNNGDGESNNRINFPFSQHIHTIPVNLTMPQISLELDDLSICRIDQIALNDYPHLACHIFELFSDKATLRFIPEKEVIDLKSARQWLLTSLMKSQCGRNQTHLISRSNKKVEAYHNCY